MVMDLDDEIGSLRDRPDAGFGVRNRNAARGPTADQAGSLKSRAAETRIAAFAGGEPASRAGWIEKDQRVMDDAPVSGTELEPADIGVLFEVQRNDETLKLIG